MKVDPTRNIDELFDFLPEEERLTAAVLRDLVRECLPHAREKLSWGAPFYHGRRSICFIWPASIPWGKLDRGVALGFARADLLDHGGYLSQNGTSRLGRKVFYAPEEVDVERVMELLKRAGEVDGG